VQEICKVDFLNRQVRQGRQEKRTSTETAGFSVLPTWRSRASLAVFYDFEVHLGLGAGDFFGLSKSF